MSGDLVYGQNDRGEAVVLHLAYPRLILRVVEVDENGETLHPDEDADLLSGITFSGEFEGGHFMLCEGAKLDSDEDFNLSSTIRTMAHFVAGHLENERGTHAMDKDEFTVLFEKSELSAHAFAEKMNVSARAIRRILKGEQSVPSGLAADIRRRWG